MTVPVPNNGYWESESRQGQSEESFGSLLGLDAITGHPGPDGGNHFFNGDKDRAAGPGSLRFLAGGAGGDRGREDRRESDGVDSQRLIPGGGTQGQAAGVNRQGKREGDEARPCPSICKESRIPGPHAAGSNLCGAGRPQHPRRSGPCRSGGNSGIGSGQSTPHGAAAKVARCFALTRKDDTPSLAGIDDPWFPDSWSISDSTSRCRV